MFVDYQISVGDGSWYPIADVKENPSHFSVECTTPINLSRYSRLDIFRLGDQTLRSAVPDGFSCNDPHRWHLRLIQNRDQQLSEMYDRRI